jgi:hypothetical protein
MLNNKSPPKRGDPVFVNVILWLICPELTIKPDNNPISSNFLHIERFTIVVVPFKYRKFRENCDILSYLRLSKL